MLAMVETRYCVWRKREYRKEPDEGRIDWRSTREQATELKEELDQDTDCEHVVIEEIRETNDNGGSDHNNDYRIQ